VREVHNTQRRRTLRSKSFRGAENSLMKERIGDSKKPFFFFFGKRRVVSVFTVFSFG